MSVQEITIPAPADFHVHLRQGKMSELVTPHVAEGGVSLAYVMPNLVPPITSTQQAMEYLERLRALAPQTMFVGTLYLSPDLTPAEIAKAAQNGVRGVKSYPRGVTTNSDSGIEDYETYYPIFEEMQKHDMVLNLHGELPSNADAGICVLNAEEKFLTHLFKIHGEFPKLKIVLEHATTRKAVEAVKQCGDTVGCTITPHHLELIVDDWAGKPLNFCKPVAKYPDDRQALRDVIRQGHPRFFLGSDSAPHPLANKYPSAVTHGAPGTKASASGSDHLEATGVVSCGCAAGVYTSSILVPLCATLLEAFGALDQLANYVSINGRNFYGYNDDQHAKHGSIKLRKVRSRSSISPAAATVPAVYVHPEFREVPDSDASKVQVVPFWAGKCLGWEIVRS
ncbi:Dihydroorotase [Mycosarcoma maydis]|uniref:Dihydroorotase n=1 Tax=Mycosarcoma maydis TaxID=5270 RepID=PYRC_MYCMD|nr:Dihydroorotase [Ustilago maydis 521]P31301.2 RecName: Full=Dihydroorotase; Short=DHOase [Ustilago maydis 521]KIS70351.1 Dihydroorotase [Ustilago maydis 521]|eukprot:XP_011387556.1 Dihydroorotase [Ustilago maydis 521]